MLSNHSKGIISLPDTKTPSVILYEPSSSSESVLLPTPHRSLQKEYYNQTTI